MNSSIVKQLLLAILLTAGIAWNAASRADEEAETKTAIPATAAEIWKAIDTHVSELHAAVAAGKLDTVHVHAFAVRDLVQALPTHSMALSPDALKKVTEQGKFVDTLAERLDQTGDAGDKAGVETNFGKLEGVLKALRAQYPDLQ